MTINFTVLRLTLFCILTLTVLKVVARQDSLYFDRKFTDYNVRISQLETLNIKVKQIERDQLNYQIEKDLLKETYSNNFERINIIITIGLAIITIIGYLGLKDFKDLKKEYRQELEALQNLTVEFKSKYSDFKNEVEKFQNDIQSLNIENQRQGDKIKVLELKEKIADLIKKNEIDLAIQYTDAALSIDPEDITLLNQKAPLYYLINRPSDALKAFESAHAIESTSTTISNLIEAYYINGKFDEGIKLSTDNSEIFQQPRYKGLLEFFQLIELYHGLKRDEMLAKIKAWTQPGGNLTDIKPDWSYEDIKNYLYFQPINEERGILLNIVSYLEGGQDLTKLQSSLGINN